MDHGAWRRRELKRALPFAHLTTSMPPRRPHDAPPPPNWPESVQYMTKSRLSPSFPPALVPLITSAPSASKFSPRPSVHPTHVVIKRITAPGHPAQGQNGLFARAKIAPGVLIIPYLGVIHASFTPVDSAIPLDPALANPEEHEKSDYDLSLLRISASDPRDPMPGVHVSIGVDADQAGNAGRMVNDFRGVGTAPNAEFRVGKGEAGELRMELWSLKEGIKKGEEVLVSYGKGWWAGRNGD